MHKKQVLHIITGLNVGGAEMMLYKLCLYRSEGISHRIISLTDCGPLGKKLEELGVIVETLNFKKSPLIIFQFFKLVSKIKEINPDIIQTWLYHGDLIGGIAAKLAKKPVIWSIRQAKVSLKLNKWHTVMASKLCAALSTIPVKIISCTQNGATEHVAIGYPTEKIIVIPNGFEVDTYQHTRNTREKLVIHVGRYAPLKDHKSFIQAANILEKRLPEYKFHMYGDNVDESNTELMKLIKNPKIKLLGRSNSLNNIYSKVALLVSTSLSEGFSNTIGEAMLHDTPVLATDAGDSSYIVNDPFMMIPMASPLKIAAKIEKVLASDFPELHFRYKIEKRFNIKSIVLKYEKVYFNS